MTAHHAKMYMQKLLSVKNYLEAMIHHLQAAMIAGTSIFVDYLFYLILDATSPLLYQENQQFDIFNNAVSTVKFI